MLRFNNLDRFLTEKPHTLFREAVWTGFSAPAYKFA
jgi:hypothetical protein